MSKRDSKGRFVSPEDELLEQIFAANASEEGDTCEPDCPWCVAEREDDAENRGTEAARTFIAACETVADFLIGAASVLTPVSEETKEVLKFGFVKRCLDLTEDLQNTVELNSFLEGLNTTPQVRVLLADALGGEPILTA